MSVQLSPSPTVSVSEAMTHDEYLGALLKQSEGQQIRIHAEIVGWLQELRQRAAYDAARQRMPTRQDEEWRFTDLSELLATQFVKAQTVVPRQSAIAPLTLKEASQSRLVFVNGVYSPEYSDVSALPDGVFVGNLAQLPLEDTYEAIKYIAHHDGEQEVFTALNSTGFPDVAVIWAKKNVIVETPIHLLFVTSVEEHPTFCLPRGLIVAEKGASLTVLEQYSVTAEDCSDRPTQHPYFTNSVMEVFVEENARVNHTLLQRESGDAFHICKTAVAQSRNSHYTCNTLHLGAKLSRHNLDVWQKGEHTETYLNGLTLIGREQISDTHSGVWLNYPHGTTNHLHKCIVDHKAHAIFSGKVTVPQKAQETNAAQLNRNLLLSPKARIDTKPQLQITADNVKCTHGATISQIDADELFYLQSRGINADSARNLLLDAFAAEILDRLPLPSLQKMVAQCVSCRTYE
ncbi:Fe-S cluster assembly protein SufD [Spirulina subsalsa FACHB-351]|uniref:Fe-S cluster assembly protein SufD n=1 Tax=Spirulina subsalsa FACHB-351 TaxID=234711 RepID=A0ABT3LAL1_9CYAN|nr:Fe-S cluster assembly protein SufD [Spirulina subsalsa]MCW6038020.1 Fe-S cluster assembly protein SufD [Spirulina subsalsa FACHB-351]